jgi:hypothetical protein
MFPQTTFVRGFGFKDLSNNQVLSYGAAKMEDFVRGLYGPLASGAGDQLPTPSTFLENPKWQELVMTLHRLDEGSKDPRDRFKLFEETGFKNFDGIQRDLALFQLFHTPPSTALTQKYSVPASDPKSRAEWRTHARAELPKADDYQKLIDFHQIVAAMNQYPTLLRKLGLVVDLLINKKAFPAVSNAALEVEVKLPELPPNSSVQSAPAASALTRTLLDAKRFQPVPRLSPKPGDYRVANGLLDLNPKVFDLVQTDVDGAGLKVMNFARTLGLLQRKPATQVHPVSKQEHELGAPALRNAGLMLVHANRGGMLKNSFDRQKLFNTTVEAIHNGAGLLGPELFAEDLVRGYRLDIWDRKTRRWKSLCQREATYDLNEPRKTRLRRMRRERIHEWVELLADGPRQVKALLDLSQQALSMEEARELVRAAELLRGCVLRASMELLRYTVIPKDSDTTCRCGRSDHHTLPAWLDEQTLWV